MFAVERESSNAGGCQETVGIHFKYCSLRGFPNSVKLGNVDVGPVWATEIQHAREMGMKIGSVEPGEHLDQRDRVNYYIARLKNSRNPENAEKFIQFISGPVSREIYKRFGFVPHD